MTFRLFIGAEEVAIFFAFEGEFNQGEAVDAEVFDIYAGNLCWSGSRSG